MQHKIILELKIMKSMSILNCMSTSIFFRLSPGGEDPHLIFIQVFLPKAARVYSKLAAL